MRTCDICNTKLGFMNKFRYTDGYICKSCYKKASRQFTETINQKTFEEIKELCYSEDTINGQDFEITGKIGNYLLVDEKNSKICILSNRISNKKVATPSFYNVEEIKECRIICEPTISRNQLEEKILKREEEVINKLKVQISFKEKPAIDILFIQTGARIKSYAFRQSFTFAKRIQEEITRLQKTLVSVENEEELYEGI